MNSSTGQIERKEISFADLLALTDSVDPFTVTTPTTNPQSDPNFQKLLQSKFMMGVKARIGMPPMDNSTAIPDMVVLGGDSARNEWGACSWNQTAQGPNDPWIYSTYVDLRLGQVPNTDYSKLPADVQNTIKNFGDSAFSIQQLLLDLANAGLGEVPKISGIDNTMLKGYVDTVFVPRYIATPRDRGELMPGCAVVPQATSQATLGLTDLNFALPACAPTTIAVRMELVDESDSANYHGVVAIGRNKLRDWLEPLVKKTAESHSMNLTIFARHHDSNIRALYVELYKSGLVAPKIEYPADGETVLRFTHETASDDDDAAGKAEIQYKYSMEVDLVDNNIIITQHAWVRTYIKAGAIDNDNVMVDSTVVDTYEIAVDSTGALGISAPSTTNGDTANPDGRNGSLNFGVRINDDMDAILESLKSFNELRVDSIPLSTAQQFIFPGGKTFTFKKTSFSDFRDLVSYIVYTEPT